MPNYKKLSRKPKIGISACTLGQQVRYDGTSKRMSWLTDVLSSFVDFVPICPEVRMGLGVPRESLRLVHRGENISIIGNKSKTDYTNLANESSQHIIKDLKQKKLDGFIFKSKSPTCGLERVKIYNEEGIPDKTGSGIFAQSILNDYSNLALIEEGMLNDPNLREHFINSIYCFAELNDLATNYKSLEEFHRTHKLDILSRSPSTYKELGGIVAAHNGKNFEELLVNYKSNYFRAMNDKSTKGRKLNSLEHAFGFFKEVLAEEDRKYLKQQMEDYYKEYITYPAIIQLFKYFIEKGNIQYLKEQSFFEPYPKELGLAIFHK